MEYPKEYFSLLDALKVSMEHKFITVPYPTVVYKESLEWPKGVIVLNNTQRIHDTPPNEPRRRDNNSMRELLTFRRHVCYDIERFTLLEALEHASANGHLTSPHPDIRYDTDNINMINQRPAFIRCSCKRSWETDDAIVVQHRLGLIEHMHVPVREGWTTMIDT